MVEYCGTYTREHRFDRVEYFIIAETNSQNAERRKIIRAMLIVYLRVDRIVHRPVDFDNKFQLWRIKVHDVLIDVELPPKHHAVYLPRFQTPPQLFFRSRRTVTKLPPSILTPKFIEDTCHIFSYQDGWTPSYQEGGNKGGVAGAPFLGAVQDGSPSSSSASSSHGAQSPPSLSSRIDS